MKACWSPHAEQVTGAPLIAGSEALSTTWGRQESAGSEAITPSPPPSGP